MLAALLSTLSLALPAAWAAPVFSTSSIDPVVFYTSPGSGCATNEQPTNSVTLPTASSSATGTISYAITGTPMLPTGVTLSGNTLTGAAATIIAQDSTSYTYRATDSDDNMTADLTFTIEIVSEKAILQTLYDETGGDNWKTKTGGWDNPIAPTSDCLKDLHGVTISNGATERGRVIRIHLQSNNLTGEIPEELGKLTGLLHDLWLQSNNLSGTIPTELGSLTKLRGLALFRNSLTGEIPSELGGLTSLTHLQLHENQLTGSIPDLSTLTSLTHLNLEQNQLTGSIPDLSALTSLIILQLRKNQLTGSIPNLSALTSLTTLRLEENRLTGSIPELSATSLTVLNLEENQLTGSIPELNALTSLVDIFLHDNKLTGSIPDLSALTSLGHLQLHNNDLSGSIPDLTSLTSLNYLYLHNNRLTGEIPDFPSPGTGAETGFGVLRLSLYGNAGLYGYPSALDDRNLLRLVAPGDGSAVCLPTTRGGSDCTVPTLVDNLRVEADTGTSELVYSWAPNPADPPPGDYSARYILPPASAWTTVTPSTATTVRVPDTNLAFLVRTAGAPQSPELYWLPGFSPPRSRPQPPPPVISAPPAPPPPPPPPPPPVIESAEGVLHSEEAEDGFSLTPVGEGGNIVYGEMTINVSVTRDECLSSDSNPAVIVSRNILDQIMEITFELSEVSPQDPPSGFRLEGCAAEIDLEGVELAEEETVTVCLPSVEGEGHIRHYDEESGEWEPLSTVSKTVNGKEMLCAETDALSLFGVFVIEETVSSSGSGCAVAPADGEAGTAGRWEKAVLNLLLVMSVLFLLPGGSLSRRPGAGKASPLH